MGAVTRVFDLTLAAAKWPLALAFLAVLPGVAIATWSVVGGLFEGGVVTVLNDAFMSLFGLASGKSILGSDESIAAFILGAGGYVLVWLALFRRHFAGSFFSTLEHELTHAVVALATFHPVSSTRATWNDGGSMSYSGGDNWLITIAPYFLPTLSIGLIIGLYGFLDSDTSWPAAVLGVTIAYHVTSTWLETHAQQTALQEVGFPFAFLFLPTANLLCYGLLITFSRKGLSGIEAFLDEAYTETAYILQLTLDSAANI